MQEQKEADSVFMVTSNFVILGGTGFVGSAVLERLAAMPQGSVRANILVRSKDKIKPYPFAEYYTGELPFIPDGLFPSCPHVVLHFANKNIDRDKTGYEINLQAAKALIQAANRWTIGFIYGSSLSVHGQGAQDGVTETESVNPQTPLAKSRLCAENAFSEYAAKSGKSVLLLRPRFIIGRNDAYTMPTFVEIFRKGFMAGSGNQKYSFIDVNDYAEIILRLSSVITEWHNAGGGRCTPVNIGYRKPVSLNELYAIFEDVLGTAGRPLLRVPSYRWLPGFIRRLPFKGARQMATRLELLGFSHYSDVSLLAGLAGEDIPAKDPAAVLKGNLKNMLSEGMI